MDDVKTFTIEGARIIFRNFSGRATAFKPEGTKTFTVVLPLDRAEELYNDGWNVKYREPREEGDELEAHIEVAVNFKYRPPRVVALTSGGRTYLNDETVGMLDAVDLENVDVICRAYEWEVGEKSGIKAYLQTGFFTIYEDELERKYAIKTDE